MNDAPFWSIIQDREKKKLKICILSRQKEYFITRADTTV